jgi:hypothetical protein
LVVVTSLMATGADVALTGCNGELSALCTTGGGALGISGTITCVRVQPIVANGTQATPHHRDQRAMVQPSEMEKTIPVSVIGQVSGVTLRNLRIAGV